MKRKSIPPMSKQQVKKVTLIPQKNTITVIEVVISMEGGGRGEHKRSLKSQDSCKLDAYCTAGIVITQNEHGIIAAHTMDILCVWVTLVYQCWIDVK